MRVSNVVLAEDGFHYKKEDTHWLDSPTDEDPGILMPNPGAKSLEEMEVLDEND